MADSSVKTLLTGAPAATAIQASADRDSPRGRGGRRRAAASASKDYLWKGWILPASDSDVWLTAGSAAYYDVLNGDDVEERAQPRYRAQFRAAALEHDQPLSRLVSSTTSSNWHTHRRIEGRAVARRAAPRSMGDDAFYALMRDFFDKNTTKTVHASDFVAAGGRSQQALFAKWLDGTGLPDTAEGPIYTADAIASAARLHDHCVWNAGGGRRESLRGGAMAEVVAGHFESAVPYSQGFRGFRRRSGATTTCCSSDGRKPIPRWRRGAKRIALDYDGGVFRVAGKDHASENEALIWTAANPRKSERTW